MASRWLRLWARFLDVVILIFVLWIAPSTTGGVIPSAKDTLMAYSVGGVVLIIVSWFYEKSFIAASGQTPGKMVAGICVVRMDNGGVPGWEKRRGAGRCHGW